jgi:hypothetical protein
MHMHIITLRVVFSGYYKYKIEFQSLTTYKRQADASQVQFSVR